MMHTTHACTYLAREWAASMRSAQAPDEAGQDVIDRQPGLRICVIDVEPHQDAAGDD